MARVFKPWNHEDRYFETRPSENAQSCADIILKSAWNEDKKLGLLKNILRHNPACVHEKQPFYGGYEAGKNNGTLLNIAVCRLYRRITDLLLQYGADPNVCDRWGIAPVKIVHDAMLNTDCNEDESFEFFRLLLSYGANLKTGNVLKGAFMYTTSDRIMRLLMYYSAKDAMKHLKYYLKFWYGQKNVLTLVNCLLAQNPNNKRPSFLWQYEKLLNHWDNCIVKAESERNLINERLRKDTILTVRRISVANERMLANYVRNDTIEELSTKHTHMYPLYGIMIETRCQRGKRRMLLENQGLIVVRHSQPPLCDFYMWRKILQYLELHELKNLREAGILVLNSNA